MILEQKVPKQNIIIGGIALFVLLLYLIPFVLAPALRSSNELKFSYSSLITSSLYCWLCLLVMYVYSTKVEKQKILIWTEKQYPLKFYIKFFALAPFMLLGLTIVIAIILKSFNYSPSHISEELNQILKNHKFMILFASLTAGVTEELLFRGYLMTRLELLFKNRNMSIVISSVFFALGHIGWESMIKLAVVFLIGLTFAFLYYKYRNIKILIILHFLLDLTSLSIGAFR